MALNDVYKASAIFTAPKAAGPMVVTYHYRNIEENGSLTPAQECLEVATEVGETLESLFMTLVSDTISLERVDAFGITVPTAEATYASGTAGTWAQETVGFRNTVIVRNKTGLRGRSFTGYQSYPPPREDVQDGGELTVGFLADMATLALGLKRLSQQASTNKYDQVVYSKLLNSNALVTTYIVRPMTGSNKRRQSTTG